MAFKVVTVIFALIAIVSAGGLVHPVTYTQFHNVAVAHPSSADEAHQIHHDQSQYSQGAEASHIHYVPAYAKTVHIAGPVHSGPVYAAPAFTHVTYGAQSYGRSLGFNEGPSSTASSHSSEEAATTTAEPTTTTETTTAEAENTEETSSSRHASRSAEPEPTQVSYQHEPATSPGYRYDAPSASSSSETHSNSGLPTFFKYQPTPLQQASGHHHVPVPSIVKYEVPAQTVVKYAAPTHYAATAPHQTLVHYAAPVQTVYHKTVAPQPVHIKYANPEPAVYTSFGEHPPAIYSHHTGPASTVHHHHTYAAPQPSFIKYAAPVQAPGQVTYVAPAPAVYTKYGVTESTTHAKHVVPAPTAFIKYASPAAITHTTYVAPQHSAETSSTKLVKYDGPAFHIQSESSTESQSPSLSSSDEENKDSIEVKSPESTTASYEASRAYLPPAPTTHLVSHTYQVPSEQEQYRHEESARSHSNEHNIWSTDGASSHVSFKGFGTSYGY